MEDVAASASDGKSLCRKAVLTGEMEARGEISSSMPIATSAPCWIFATGSAIRQNVESTVAVVIRRVVMAVTTSFACRLERWSDRWIRGLSLADLVTPDQCFIAARGGRGGRGNARFKSPTKQAPRYAQPGEPGETGWLTLELKLLADVGLMGLPNAGKSTLLARISAARPKIAPYPFTTLVPQLGIVRLRDERSCVMADIPGIIEGAHEGKGLGHQFLRHIERTRLLIHLVDMTSAGEDDPLLSFDTVNHELLAYAPQLAEKPQVVVATKMDVPAAKQAWERFQPAIAALGLRVIAISAVTGEGVGTLLDEIDRALVPVRSVIQSNPSRERTL